MPRDLCREPLEWGLGEGATEVRRAHPHSPVLLRAEGTAWAQTGTKDKVQGS